MNPQTTPTRVRKSATVMLLGVGIFLGLGGYTFWYAQGGSYLSNDPAACVNCHIMRDQYNGWINGPHHAAATCNDCHTPHSLLPKMYTKMINGWNHSRAFTLQDFHEPIQITPRNAQIVQESCMRCHSGIMAEVEAHAGPEVLHCVQCHRRAGHGR